MTGPVRPEEIYEALVDEEAFARLPVLLAEIGGGRSAELHWRHADDTCEYFPYTYFSTALLEDYVENFLDQDPWAGFLASRGAANRALIMDRVAPVGAYERSAVYNDCLRRHGDDTSQFLSMRMEAPWGEGLVMIHRGARQARFEDANAAAIEEAGRHLRQLMRVRGRLAADQRSVRFARTALDCIDHAALTVLRDGRVALSNASAEMVLARADGLTIKGGRLSGQRAEAARALETAIAAATRPVGAQASAVTIRRDQGLTPYRITVTPVIGKLGMQAALLVFDDPDSKHDPIVEQLRTRFDLTQAEAHIAAGFGDGLGRLNPGRLDAGERGAMAAQLKVIAAKMGLGPSRACDVETDQL